MTTAVKIHVNGRYRATVRRDNEEPVVVEGNYEGSPNPSGEHVFWLNHTPEKGSHSIFEITEEYVPEETK